MAPTNQVYLMPFANGLKKVNILCLNKNKFDRHKNPPYLCCIIKQTTTTK